MAEEPQGGSYAIKYVKYVCKVWLGFAVSIKRNWKSETSIIESREQIVSMF